nr:coiled-coil-helix-coiled-coil-helix domain-containing protein 7 [Ciona intestinalis]|eukprot:XP_002123826.5 coiled-coil-helix-coiled-coil-helix domain-containing protein 7 [Ciona intestinalis]
MINHYDHVIKVNQSSSMQKMAGKKTTNYFNRDVNPCVEEQKESIACLEGNNYKKDKCNIPFANYQECVGFWKNVSRKRNQQGIQPAIPTLSEQEQIKRFLGDKLPYIALSDS